MNVFSATAGDFKRVVVRQRMSLYLVGLYFGLHYLFYVYFVEPTMHWQLFDVGDYEWYWWLASIILGLIPGLFLPSRIERVNDLAPWIQYVCIVGPAAYVPMHCFQQHFPNIFLYSIAFTVCLYLFERARKYPMNFNFRTSKNSEGAFTYGFLVVALLVTMYIWRAIDFKFDLGWGSMYDRRLAVRPLLAGGTPLGYLNTLFIKGIVPLSVLFAIARKNYSLLWLTLLCVLVSFSFDGTKLVIFLPLGAMALAYQWKTKKISTFIYGLIAAFLAIGGLALSGSEAGAELARSVIIRQTYSLAEIASFYFDYFVNKPFNWFNGSPFLGWISPEKVMSPYPRVIGFEYFNSVDTNLNTGIFASAYAEGGYFSMFLTAIAAGLIINFIASLGERRSRFLGFCFCSLIAIEWTNSSFFTSFLSGGVVVLSLVLYFYPTEHAIRDEVLSENEIPKGLVAH